MFFPLFFPFMLFSAGNRLNKPFHAVSGKRVLDKPLWTVFKKPAKTHIKKGAAAFCGSP